MRKWLFPFVMTVAVGAVGPRATAQTPPAAPAFTPANPAAFPAGPGRDTMLRVCGACHDPTIASQQRLSPDGWKEIVDQMAARGATATDAELDQITAYLAKSFPAGK